MLRCRALVVVFTLAWWAHGQTVCAPSGLTLSTSGGRLGDPVSLTLSGSPLASGVLGFDTSPGPVATPIGTICLGLSPAFVTAPFVLDSAGSYAVSPTLPPTAALAGVTYFIQAAAQDASQPGGFALSNSRVLSLRQPRLFFISTGAALPPGGGIVPGTLRKLDALTDTLGPPITLAGVVQAAIAVPALARVVTAVLATGGPLLVAYDATTLAFSQSITLPAAAIGAPLQLAVSGTTIVVACTGGVVAYQLPSTTPLFTFPMAGTKGVILPGGPSGYLVLPTSVVPFSLATGILSAAINVGGPGFGNTWAWTVAGNIIYFTLWTGLPPGPALGAGVNGVDTSLNAALFPSPVQVAISSYPSLIRSGPGSAGPAVFVGDETGTVILQLSPSTLLATAPPIITSGGSSLELSNGGTEWLFCGGGQVQSMNPATLAITPTGIAIPSNAPIVPLPSASINKAYVYTSFLTIQLTPLATDPTTAAGSPITFPAGLGGYTFFVVD